MDLSKVYLDTIDVKVYRYPIVRHPSATVRFQFYPTIASFVLLCSLTDRNCKGVVVVMEIHDTFVYYHDTPGDAG